MKLPNKPSVGAVPIDFPKVSSSNGIPDQPTQMSWAMVARNGQRNVRLDTPAGTYPSKDSPP
ncbi:hypothetical protein GcM1_208004 [Golovinomyces cichoracearum]|uniref:Uncharacterized protein n=1 Tax=Golovinomyces cichoracearum TaxID=62708 RepID=A0A420IW08_9PEZI|nr:hypothetical protein GcM1_208004 [Golovinomyces cichoracearum]